jgi:hypothetical protein
MAGLPVRLLFVALHRGGSRKPAQASGVAAIALRITASILAFTSSAFIKKGAR